MAEESGKTLHAQIKSCTCYNEGQDLLHGKGKRVFNPFKMKDGKTLNYRCTVCGKEQA
jgi:hypothetical protein